jgi:hypothetical protein
LLRFESEAWGFEIQRYFRGLTMARGVKGAIGFNSADLIKPVLPVGQGPSKSGDERDKMSEEWACRDHGHNVRYRQAMLDGSSPDGPEYQSLQVCKGRIVNPKTSMCTGGSMVKGRSKKGKYLKQSFVYGMSKSDARIESPTPKYVQREAVQFAPRHAGTPVKTAKHVPLRAR